MIMKIKKSFSICIFVLCFSLFLSGCANSKIQTINNTEPASGEVAMSKARQAAEKIEVVHFHATEQCWSCKTVGEFALKTIKEKFPEEYKNGTIVFKDINGELPENRELVQKFQASGSALFINAIINGHDNIAEDVTVWRLISDEGKFVGYFQNKLNELIDK